MLEVKCGFDDHPGGLLGVDALITYGPTLYVNIGFDSNWIPNDGKIPNPGANKIEALVDTGATISCIDDQLAQDLKLPVIDKRSMGGVGGEHVATIYLAQIFVIALNKTIYGDFAGVHLKAGGQVHQALLGRTFLRYYTMTYDGKTGTVVLKES
jgi:predicted aspartyl protease